MANAIHKPILNRELFITTIIAFLGFLLVGYINSCNDKSNKLREVKINYLIDAYTKLANASQRNIDDPSYHRDIELAISKIQLFGSDEEVESLNKAIENSKAISINDTLRLNLDNVLYSLRNSLRKEINLNPINDKIEWFRFSERKEINQINNSPVLPKSKKQEFTLPSQ